MLRQEDQKFEATVWVKLGNLVSEEYCQECKETKTFAVYNGVGDYVTPLLWKPLCLWEPPKANNSIPHMLWSRYSFRPHDSCWKFGPKWPQWVPYSVGLESVLVIRTTAWEKTVTISMPELDKERSTPSVETWPWILSSFLLCKCDHFFLKMFTPLRCQLPGGSYQKSSWRRSMPVSIWKLWVKLSSFLHKVNFK